VKKIAMMVGLVATLSGCAALFSSLGAAPAEGTGGRHTEIPILEDDPADDLFDDKMPGGDNGFSIVMKSAARCTCMAVDAEGKLAGAIAHLNGEKPEVPASEMRDACIANSLLANMPMFGGGGQKASTLISGAKDAKVSIDDYGNISVTGAPMLQMASTPVSQALTAATAAQQTCSALTLQMATSVNSLSINPGNNHGLENLPLYLGTERARLIRLIRASHHADIVSAGATALAASFRKAVETSDPKWLDATTSALSDALPVGEVDATKAELLELMTRGDAAAQKIFAEADEWARQHLAAQGKSHDVAGRPVMRDTGKGDSDAAAVASAFMGLFTGDVGAIVGGASVLFPEDSPIRHGLKATSSLLKGDVAGTLESAAKMVPPGNKMKTALDLAAAVADAAS
jgi:hypothetical protein